MRKICEYCTNKAELNCLVCHWLYTKYPIFYEGRRDFTKEELRRLEEPIRCC